jgi:OmpR family response regulator RpaB
VSASPGQRGLLAVVIGHGASLPEPLVARLFRLGLTVMERQFSDDTPRLLRELHPDLVVVAVDATQPEAAEAVGAIARNTKAYLLVYSAQGDERTVAAILDAGADAEITGPPHPRLFDAKAGVGLRRRRAPATAMEPETDTAIHIRGLVIDAERREVTCLGRFVALTPVEFDILSLLVRNAGRILPPLTIASAAGIQPVNVRIFISRIRGKLEAAGGEPDYIVNARGAGYMFERRTRPTTATCADSETHPAK